MFQSLKFNLAEGEICSGGYSVLGIRKTERYEGTGGVIYLRHFDDLP